VGNPPSALRRLPESDGNAEASAFPGHWHVPSP